MGADANLDEMLAREKEKEGRLERVGKRWAEWAVWGNEDERGEQRGHQDKSSRVAGEW